MAADVCFYDFSHVVTKGHNNNLWQPAAPIVSFIGIKNGVVCGHGPSLFMHWWEGGAGREVRCQCVCEGRGQSNA